MTRESLDAFGAFYRTRPHPCPYLDGQQESRIFTGLTPEGADIQYQALTRAGFRRSHRMAYRPACPSCNACVPVRVLAQDFAPSRSQRRVLKRNADLSERELPPRDSDEQYRLFSRYLASRHGEGPMAQMTPEDYRAMVEETPVGTDILEYRDAAGKLVGACLADRLSDGYSAVYSFSDPDEAKRGLGNFMILRLIERARARGLAFVYLGYWIAESPKMSYKDRFHPIEALGAEGWRLLTA
ncbi:MAG TPA: arginyltransferase [Alphaproteobacteria bacterium]|nr:arginyltransferase [Alphaproteobacteria bacterium]